MAKHDVDIDGWWMAVEAELGGVTLPAEALSDLVLRFLGGTFRFGVDEGRIVINRHVRPVTLDLIPTRGPNRNRIVPAIIDVSSTDFRICLDLAGIHRPLEFRAPAGTRRFLATYRRVAHAARSVDHDPTQLSRRFA